MAPPNRPRLALDHNFPEPLLDALRQYVVDCELTPLREIHAGLPDLEDRPLLIALRQLGIPGLVTNNYKMLKNPRELAAVIASKVTVFAIEGVGHDPLRATGALLLDLPGALKRMDTRRPQVFWLRPRNPDPKDPRDLFTDVAHHQHRDRDELWEQVKVGPGELRRRVLPS